MRTKGSGWVNRGRRGIIIQIQRFSWCIQRVWFLDQRMRYRQRHGGLIWTRSSKVDCMYPFSLFPPIQALTCCLLIRWPYYPTSPTLPKSAHPSLNSTWPHLLLTDFSSQTTFTSSHNINHTELLYNKLFLPCLDLDELFTKWGKEEKRLPMMFYMSSNYRLYIPTPT